MNTLNNYLAKIFYIQFKITHNEQQMLFEKCVETTEKARVMEELEQHLA